MRIGALPRSAMTNRQGALRIIGILVVVACLARVVHLNADPSVSTWIGYVADEGRWSETARNVALFGTSEGSSNARVHLFLTPGYQAVNYVVFRMFGVDFWSARLFVVVCGILTLAAVFFALRRHVTPFALALGVVILGFEANMLSESRMALPELPSVFFCLLAFFVLMLGQKTRWNALIAGLLAVTAVSMKGTTLLAVLIFPFLAFLSSEGQPARERSMRMLLFVIGFAVPVAAGLSIAMVLGLVDPEGIAGAARTYRWFWAVVGPYTVLMRFFDSAEFEARNLMLLGAWFCSWVWFHRGVKERPVASKLYLASGAWAGWWLVMWSANTYLPGRYLVHFIVPATIHIMTGLSLAGNDLPERIAAAFRRRRGIARAVSLAWLLLPSVIFLAAVATGLVEIGGWDSASLSLRIAMITMLTGALAMAVWRRVVNADVIAAFLLFPVLMTLIWLGARELGVVRHFWTFPSGTTLAVWMVVSLLAFVVCLALARQLSSSYRSSVAQAGIVAVVATILFAPGAPAILWPTYSIRDASLDLQQRFPATSKMRTFSAESLFLANKLKFRALGHDEPRYDGIVVFEHGLQSRKFLASTRAAGLDRVEDYPITISPRYETDESRYGPASIGVYKPR